MQFFPQRMRVFSYCLIRLDKVDRYTEGNAHYIPISFDGLGYRMCHEADHSREFHISHADLYQRLMSGTAEIEHRYHAKEVQRLRLIWGDTKFTALEPVVKKVARRREWFVLKCEAVGKALGKALPWSDKIDPLLARWNCEQQGIDPDTLSKGGRTDQDSKWIDPPSWKSVQRWHDEYNTCNRNILALADRRKGPGDTRYTIKCVESYAFAYRRARCYLDRLEPTPQDVFDDYETVRFEENERRALSGKNPLLRVGRTKFFEIIKSFDQFEMAAARKGERWAIDHFALNEGMVEATYPGELVQIDHVCTDLLTFLVVVGVFTFLPDDVRENIPQVRIWLCVAIDVATRYVVSMKATINPSSKSVIECLRLISMDKSDLSAAVGAATPWIGHIKPTIVEMDNGSEFIADDTLETFSAAGIGVERTRANHPGDRPIIESLFHSFAPFVVRYFDGRTFRSIAERGDHKPEEFVSLFCDELVGLFTFCICDIYHRKPHSALGGQSPHNAWVEKVSSYQTDVMTPLEQLRAFAVPAKCKLNDYGVVHMGIPYKDQKIQAIRNKHGANATVHFRHDPFNVRAILVRGDEGEFVVENDIGITDRITLAEWREARLRIRAEIRDGEKEGLPVMYRAINRMRRTSEGARIRAGLSVRTPSSEDYQEWDREVFKDWVAERTDGEPLPRLARIGEAEQYVDDSLLERVELPPRAKKTKDDEQSTSAAPTKAAPQVIADRADDGGSELDYDEED